jgi:hypothetical protein
MIDSLITDRTLSLMFFGQREQNLGNAANRLFGRLFSL